MTDVINMRQGRLGTVEEVAAAAAFLASDDASFVNGHALPLDNGGTSG
jgi:NAD(P)-dependent dehydrogenase (short-subunit alcohol dehydrogenase family)